MRTHLSQVWELRSPRLFSKGSLPGLLSAILQGLVSPPLKELILSILVLRSLCNYNSKTTASNTITLAVRTSTDELQRDANIHPTANTHKP